MFEKLVLRFASACRSWIMYWLVFGLQLVLLILLDGDCCLDCVWVGVGFGLVWWLVVIV